jgi:hypothetical protein
MAENVLSRLAIAITTDGVIKSTDELEKLTVAAKQTEVQASKTAKGISGTGASADVAKGKFGAMKGATQGLSYQLQDVAVQAQMGTSAFIILGQQGPQIASLFGPGGAVFGVLIAVGAMIGGTLVAAMGDAEEGTEALEAALGRLDQTVVKSKTGIFELSQRIEDLAMVSVMSARAELMALGADAQFAFNKATDSVDDLTKSTVGLPKLSILRTELDKLAKMKGVDAEALLGDLGGYMASQVGIQQQLGVVQQAVIDVGEKFGISAPQAMKFVKAASALKPGNLQSYQNFRDVVDEIGIESGFADRNLVSFRNELIAGVDAAKLAEDQAKNLQAALVQLTTLGAGGLAPILEGTAEEIAKTLDAERKKRDALNKIQAENILENDAADKKRFNQLLEADIKESAIDQAKIDRAKKTSDARLAIEKSFAQRRLDSILLSGATEFEAIKIIQDARLAKITEDRANQLISATEFEAAKTQIEKTAIDQRAAYTMAAEQMALQTAATFAGKITGLMSSAFGEQSAAAKAAFVVQQGIAIAQTIVATEMAAIAAAAQTAVLGGPLAFFASAAGIRAMGYASVGIIAGQTVAQVAGGRALGGQVRGGESYLVGERGPELLTMGTSGRIATNENLKNAVGGGGGVSIVNNVDARGSGPDVESKIRTAMEQTSAQTIATIQDLMRRRRFV